MTTRDQFVGIDGSKARLEVAVHGGSTFAVANDPAGLADVVARLAPLGATLAVLEATGGLEVPALAALAAAGVPAAAVAPRQARAVARATGRRATTDALDAATPARLAAALRPTPRPVPSAQVRAPDALLTRRRQLLDMLPMERNRRGGGVDRAVAKGLAAHVADLERQVRDADAGLRAAVAASPGWRATDDLLQRIPGIGPVASLTQPAEWPELGTVTGGQAAARAGLAPGADDRGRRRGHRRVAGGRASVRRVLAMAALAALAARRHHPALAAFAARRTAAGKAAKAVLVAVARKLVVIANAVLKSGRAWSAETALANARTA